MRNSSISGFIISIAVSITGIAALAGYGVFSLGNEIANPDVAQAFRKEFESKGVLDIFLGKESRSTDHEQVYQDEIIVPATRMGDHLFIHAELNDYHDVTLLVDTGATDIAITSDIAYDLGLLESESQEYLYNTSNGQSQRFVTQLDSIRVGDAIQHHVRASFGEARMGHGDGLLGMSFLKYYYVDVDLQREELRLRPRNP